jgi:hypothetical protein
MTDDLFGRDLRGMGCATATYQAQSCDVKSDGTHLMVTFPGVSLGVFAGQLQFTVFKGSNLIEHLSALKSSVRNSMPATSFEALKTSLWDGFMRQFNLLSID